jgi:hypothetical protein
MRDKEDMALTVLPDGAHLPIALITPTAARKTIGLLR